MKWNNYLFVEILIVCYVMILMSVKVDVWILNFKKVIFVVN